MKDQQKAPETWEYLANDNVQIVNLQPETKPEIPPEQAPVEEKPKKKMMKLNPNAASFVPLSTPQQQTPSFNPQPFQPGGFNNQFPGGQFGGPVYMNFQQFQPQFPGQMGQYGQFPQGGNPWSGGFNQQEFPSFHGGPAYVQPDMTYNGDMNVASFSRKPPVGTQEDEEVDENGQTIDKEQLKELRKMNKKNKKKTDPSKPKETNKAPSKKIIFLKFIKAIFLI